KSFRQSGHQVELRRPYVAKRRRELFKLAFDHPVVVRERDLDRDVIVLEAEVRWRYGERAHSFAGWKTLKLGNHDFDHQASSRLQMCGEVTDTCNLLVLGGQVHGRIADGASPATQTGHTNDFLLLAGNETGRRHPRASSDLLAAGVHDPNGERLRIGEVDGLAGPRL